MNPMVFGVCATALKAPERNGAAQRNSTETVMQQISARNIQSRLQHALEPDTWLSPTPWRRFALACNIKDETDLAMVALCQKQTLTGLTDGQRRWGNPLRHLQGLIDLAIVWEFSRSRKPVRTRRGRATVSTCMGREPDPLRIA